MKGYRLGEVLGEGATGRVWAATHAELGLLAAIKRVRGGDLAEASIIARLDHPHVVRIFDAGTDAEGAWIAMERAAGTLGVARSVDEWVAALDAVLGGLSAAHAAGVIHGDIKPGNVLVRTDGTAVLSDFGLAGTSAGGTPAYMAPEAFGGAASRPTTDLYSVGCLAVTLCSGHPPFGTGPWQAMSWSHATTEPRIEPLFPLPAGLVEWLHTLLEKPPGSRFQHAADARHALRSAARVRAAVVSTADQSSGLWTATRPAGEVPVEVWEEVATDAPDPAPLPLRWPDRAAPREPGQAGLGLLDLLEAPYVARGPQQDALWAALRQVEASGEPLIARIDGPAGSGRTRLGRALAQAAGESGCVVSGAEEATRVRVVWLDEQAPAVVDGPVLQVTTAPVDADVVVELPPFDPELCRRVLARWVHLRRDQVSDLADRCDGDLALALATVTEAVASGQLVQGPRGLEAAGSLRLAQSHRERFEAVLTGIPEALVEGVRWAAVLGMEVDPARHAALGGDPASLEWLVRAGLLREGTPLHWASAAAREVAMPADAARYHATVAEGIEVTDFWHGWERGVHRLAAGLLSEGVADLTHASRDYTGAGKMVQAGAQLHRAEQMLIDEGLPADDLVRVRLSLAISRLGPTHLGFDACRERLRELMNLIDEHLDDPEWAGMKSGVHGHFCWLVNLMLLPREVEPVLEGLLAEPDVHPASFHDLCYLRLAQGRPVAALRAIDRSIAMATEQNQPYVRLTATATRGIAMRHLGDPGAIAHFEAARRGLHDAGYHSADGDLARALADAHRFQGDLHGALHHYRHAVELAAQGEARSDASFELGLAICLGELGELDEAHARMVALGTELAAQGRTWKALTDLFRITVEAERGDAVDVNALEAAATTLADVGYRDPDIVRHARRLAMREEAADVARRLAEIGASLREDAV